MNQYSADISFKLSNRIKTFQINLVDLQLSGKITIHFLTYFPDENNPRGEDVRAEQPETDRALAQADAGEQDQGAQERHPRPQGVLRTRSQQEVSTDQIPHPGKDKQRTYFHQSALKQNLVSLSGPVRV